MAPKVTSKRGDTALVKSRGSGFEDGFADPPMTPSEAVTEKVLYNPARPFSERIETAIQRFMARRRMTQDRGVLFAKYLALGGIDTTQRQFTGTAKHINEWKEEGFTKDEIRGFTANDFLSHGGDPKGKFFNPSYPEHWDVDFKGIVAGFLGSYLPEIAGLNSPELRLAADTVLNFLKYIRYHDVCPEYQENLAEATRTCELALTELPRVGAAGCNMPGDFNLACRILFCSSPKPTASHDTVDFAPVGTITDLVMYEDKTTSELADGEIVKIPGSFDSSVLAPASFEAERVFMTTLALHEPEMMERAGQMREKPIRVVAAYEEVYEVKEIAFAPREYVEVYENAAKHDETLYKVGPVGYVVMIPTIIEDGWDNHPTFAEGRASDPGKPISLYLDHTVLSHLDVGMKLRLAICKTDMGLEFIKECRQILPSFHVFLPQSLMLSWKPSRPDERPPTSADDPDKEERQMQAELENEEREIEKQQRKMDPELDRQMREVDDGNALVKVMERVKI